MLLTNERYYTVTEWLIQGELFAEISKLSPVPLPDSTKLQKLFMLKYADSLVNNIIVIQDLKTVAELIVFEFGEKWEKLFTEMWAGFNLGARQVTKVTETTTKTENRKTVKDDVNKVTSYESDDLITNDGSNSIGNDDLTGNETKTTTNEIIDMQTAFNNLSLTMQNSIINTILNDVKQFTTLSIYQ